MNRQREAGKLNELMALKALANCGWMPMKHLGLWVWDKSAKHVAERKAQVLLSRLLGNGLLLRRKTATGVAAFVLSRTGAAKVNASLEEQGYTPWAHHGTDLSAGRRGDYTRYIRVLEALTFAARAGYAAIGKSGLRAGILTARSPKFKLFDGVIFDVNTGKAQGIKHVSSCSELSIARLRQLEKICELQLVGEVSTVKTAYRKLGH